MAELSQQTGKAIRTLQRQFDTIEFIVDHHRLFDEAINLLFDDTFFSRADGMMVYRAQSKNLYWQLIQHEKLACLTKTELSNNKPGFWRDLLPEDLNRVESLIVTT